MTDIRARRWSLTALGLAAAVLAAAAGSVVTLGADASAAPVAGAEAPASPAVETEPIPEPTQVPVFDPSTVKLRTDLLIDGLDEPVYLTDDGVADKCVYIVERGGTVRMWDDAGYLDPKPFLDISDRVATGPEQGLQSIAFHPKFKKNGLFYVHYNSLPDGQSVIAEFKGRPCKRASNKATKASVITIDQPYPNNNAGWIGFGPDGYLYIPMGDGGGDSPGDPRGYGQLPETLYSKVLRIDVNKGKRYAIPSDNPYAKKRKGGFPREMWAMGLRDPRRASFDRLTGDLWIGDVGQRIEEVDRIPAGVAGLNFGWGSVEGTATCHPLVPDCDPALYEPPVFAYDKTPPQRGITGGYVYRGPSIPALHGIYLFSDFASGFIWGIDADAVAAGEPAVAYQLLDAPQGFVSFGEDDAGELYVLALDGSIYRLGAEES